MLELRELIADLLPPIIRGIIEHTVFPRCLGQPELRGMERVENLVVEIVMEHRRPILARLYIAMCVGVHHTPVRKTFPAFLRVVGAQLSLLTKKGVVLLWNQGKVFTKIASRMGTCLW